MIERLEDRIAPAAIFSSATTAKYTDVDGDSVTVKFSKQILTAANVNLILATTPKGIGDQLLAIDFGALANAEAANGTTLSVTASRGPLGGDGLANVGYINAGGLQLRSVVIDGDLGKIDVGFFSAGTALRSLTVHSLGAEQLQTGAPSLSSNILGSLGHLLVKTNIDRASVLVDQDLTFATVRGSIIGGTTPDIGEIYAGHNLGVVVIGGNIVGGTSEYTGAVGAGNKVASVSVKGSVLGGLGRLSGIIFSGFTTGDADLSVLSIRHDLVGGPGNESGKIDSMGVIKRLSIGGSVIGGAGAYDTQNDNGITHRGQIFSKGDIVALRIGGELAGGGAQNSGSIHTEARLGGAFIGGSVLGGTGNLSGSVVAMTIGSLRIVDDVVGGAANGAASIVSTATHKFAVGGSIIGGTGIFSPNIGLGVAGTARIHGDVIGGSTLNTGSLGFQSAKLIHVGGAVIGGGSSSSGSITVLNHVGTLWVGGDVRGGRAGELTGTLGIGSADVVRVGGSVIGGGNSTTFSGSILGGALGAVSIGGDLRGGDTTGIGNAFVRVSGAVEAARIGSIVIGGSLIAGRPLASGTSSIGDSGAIRAEFDIGSIKIRGSVLGHPAFPAVISAGGEELPNATRNIAIKSIVVAGSVENALILGGVDFDDMPIDGNAQIGTVRVGGDWIASTMASGGTSNDGRFGDANDSVFSGGTISRIASIVIGGQVLGRAGSSDTFGFFAREIGSFTYNGIKVALTPGAANDRFSNGGAEPLGPTLSAMNADGFAVHVYEV